MIKRLAENQKTLPHKHNHIVKTVFEMQQLPLNYFGAFHKCNCCCVVLFSEQHHSLLL